MNIKLLKVLDGLVGQALTTLLPPPAVPAALPLPQSILIIRPGGIGDAVLLIPAINHLRKSCPAAAITILAEQRNAGVFALVPAVDQVWCYDRPAAFLAAQRCSYDVVIDTEQWHRLSAVVARLIRAPVKLGFVTNERQRMFTHTVEYSHDEYEADSFNRLFALFADSFQMQVIAPFLVIPDTLRDHAMQLLTPLAGRPFVAIFPGASVTERRWGTERFRLVAEDLIRRGYGVVVVGGRADYQDGEAICRAGGLNLAGRTTLAETAALLASAKLLVSGDSGVLHLAVGLDIPTVSLFGPGRALKWAPRGDKHRVLNKNLPCSPCTKFGTTPPCPYGARCMQEITVDEVVEAAVRLLLS